MPAFPELLALPAPPPGGLKDATPSVVETPSDANLREEKDKPKAPPAVVVSTQTKTIGMIHPPPDIRSIVDKTASFVARNGPEFERRILAANRGNVKFNFLNPGDPYHAYYRHKVNEQKAQTAGGSDQGSKEGAAGIGEVSEAKPATEAVRFLAPPKVVQPPEAEQYTVRLPEMISGFDLDVIKLTAQYVARNGKSFLTGLTSREHSNPQFSFLKPTHSLFTVFTSFADAYSKVLMPPKGTVEKLKKDVADPMRVLESCLARLDWEKSQERERQKAEDELEAERTHMALIDWHDFVVVETIEFAEEEEENLPQPMMLEDLIRRTKKLAEDEELAEADKIAVAESKGESIADMKDKAANLEMDAEEMRLVQEGMMAASIEEKADVEADDMGDADMEDDMDEVMEDEAPMRIVRNWKRPEDRISIGEGDSSAASRMVVSPITGELIPVSDMAEHMRISLIDPKYKEQKERMMAKLRENTLATDDEIGRNIVSLAKTRPDIFGTTEEEISNAVTAELEKKTKEEPSHVVWDGHTGSIGRTATQAMTYGMPGGGVDDQGRVQSTDSRVLLSAPPMYNPQVLRQPPPTVRPLPPPPGLVPNIPRFSTLPVRQSLPPLPTPPQGVQPQSGLPPLLPPSQQQISMPPPLPAGMHPTQMMQPQSIPPPPLPQGPHPGGQYMTAVYGQPMPGGHMPPPMMPMPPPPPPEEPDFKRQKVEEPLLVPESQFLASHPGPTRILVVAPAVDGESSLHGQTVEVFVDSLSESTGAFKERIAAVIGLPANKQKLSGRGGFFKDSNTLAYYNVGPGDVVTLGLRERGGRKK